MPRILIWPYSSNSKGALALKAALGAQFIKKQNSQYVPKPDDLIINWGSTGIPDFGIGKALNHPSSVARAIDKTRTFERLKAEGVPTVPWTTDQDEARNWLDKGHTVVCRMETTSSGGKGIKILTPQEALQEALQRAPGASGYQGTWEWLKGLVASNSGQQSLFYMPWAPLYTQYMEKEAEFRVHVGGSNAIHTQMKLRKHGVEPQQVWNHDNGYTFTSQLEGRIDPAVLHSVREVGIRAVKALGLDFGAADIAWVAGNGLVLEINTAPGLEEPTCSRYAEYFRGLQ